MHIMSTNFAKKFVWTHEYESNYDVTKTEHHKQMATICQWMTPPWKLSAYATDKCAQYMKNSWLILDHRISTTVIYIGFVCEFLLSPWMYWPQWESFYKREQWECCCYGRICRGLALSLLQVRSCGNHYTWNKEILYSPIAVPYGTGCTIFLVPFLPQNYQTLSMNVNFSPLIQNSSQHFPDSDSVPQPVDFSCMIV